MASQHQTVLVTGASGTQGGHVIRELITASSIHPDTSLTIHALVRDPNSSASRDLLALDSSKIKLFKGNFDDIGSLSRAAQYCTTVFLNVTPVFVDPSGELRHARNILSASLAAGVKYVILASVAGLDESKNSPSLDAYPFFKTYFANKAAIADMVRQPPFPTPEGYTYTILEPATFLTNYLPPAQTVMYPTLTAPEPTFHVAYTPTLSMSHLDPADIGRFAARAIYAPAEEFTRLFANKAIPIASVNMTISDVAEALTRAAKHKKTVRVNYLSPEEVAAQKDANLFIEGQLMLNGREYLVHLEKVRSYGIELGSVEGFFERERERLAKALAL
ncbi:hypothetical protein PV05_04466 [Exophiala xenobiotica]|uniref:NmrA-like domain-containing protein n=1 Tax=Exophiala xenobiotica TaxID=348802 RepID=A0A0D2D005_9EURO|nr:uncharacterized protein PV05_04466 [Exophiala xenobiotica]KIW55737.1 hypothetical protein PV05_04466 [Exophiala xenobiotica]